MALGSGKLEQRFEMGVQVYKARRYHEPRGVDHTRGVGRIQRGGGNAHNACADYGDICPNTRCAGAVDDGAMLNEDVVRGSDGRRPRGNEHGTGESVKTSVEEAHVCGIGM